MSAIFFLKIIDDRYRTLEVDGAWVDLKLRLLTFNTIEYLGLRRLNITKILILYSKWKLFETTFKKTSATNYQVPNTNSIRYGYTNNFENHSAVSPFHY